MIDKRLQAIGILAPVNDPVAERRGVVVAATEPAVVENEALDAQGGGCVRLGLQGIEAVVEIIAFPGVQRHRTRAHGAARPRQDLRAHEGLQRRRVLGGIDDGALVAVPSGQADLAGFEQRAEMDEAAAVVERVDGDQMVAAPTEMEGKAGVANGDAEVGLPVVAGAAAAVLLQRDAGGEVMAADLELAPPHAREAGRSRFARRQKEAAGHAAIERVDAVLRRVQAC